MGVAMMMMLLVLVAILGLWVSFVQRGGGHLVFVAFLVVLERYHIDLRCLLSMNRSMTMMTSTALETVDMLSAYENLVSVSH